MQDGFFSPWHEIIGDPSPDPLQLWENSDYYFYSSQLCVSLLGHSSGAILRGAKKVRLSDL
jgi:hypothetical protein